MGFVRVNFEGVACCRLGSEKKLGRWTDEETAKLKEAVEEYMKLHKARKPLATDVCVVAHVSLVLPAF